MSVSKTATDDGSVMIHTDRHYVYRPTDETYAILYWNNNTDGDSEMSLFVDDVSGKGTDLHLRRNDETIAIVDRSDLSPDLVSELTDVGGGN